MQGLIAAFGVTALGALLVVTPLGAGSLDAQTAISPQAAQAVATFSVRADPRVAGKVNTVLAQLADPIEMRLPGAMTADAYLDRLCGGRRPSRVEAVKTADSSATGERIRFSPCIVIRRNVEVTIDRNNTLEGIAVRNGLSRDSVKTMTVKPGPNSDASRVITPTTLLPDDLVVIPEVPQWTLITASPEVVPNRASLLSALAAEIGCASRDAEECLGDMGVRVLESGVVKKTPDAIPDALFEAAAALQQIMVPAVASAAFAFEKGTAAAASASPVPVAAAAAGAPAPFVDAYPVARQQWPYDASQLAAILKHAKDNDLLRHDPIVIGIGDGGLAAPDGRPLPQDMFAPFLEDDPEPDTEDDDGNRYLNDLIGAGLFRRAESVAAPLIGTGDIALCGTPTDFASWQAGQMELASHGSIVSSIAGGQLARAANPAAAAWLPRIWFYRLVDDACADAAAFDGNVRVNAFNLAFDYLDRHSQIINLSYTIDPDEVDMLRSVMRDNLMSSNKLLVVPAGNNDPGLNLDKRPNTCPACLGDSRRPDNTVALRTTVVGAASRDLRRQSFSNFGLNTVWLYAPGEPTGALDVRGQDASTLKAATSYAAPYASLAAAIMWSLGIDDVKRVKERLDVATWPLFQNDGRSDPAQGGVLDLVKAAAVRLHAVDVREADPDGTTVRRTYVGTLTGALSELNLCDGKTFRHARTQALRFETNAYGDRQVRVYPRNTKDDTQHKWNDPETCRLPSEAATVSLTTLDNVKKTFPVADVLQIQTPWVLKTPKPNP